MTSDEYIAALEQKQERREEVSREKEKRKVDLEINKNQKAKEKKQKTEEKKVKAEERAEEHGVMWSRPGPGCSATLDPLRATLSATSGNFKCACPPGPRGYMNPRIRCQCPASWHRSSMSTMAFTHHPSIHGGNLSALGECALHTSHKTLIQAPITILCNLDTPDCWCYRVCCMK